MSIYTAVPPPLPAVPPPAVIVHLASATLKLTGGVLYMAVSSYALLPPEIKPAILIPYGSQILACYVQSNLVGSKYGTMQELALYVHGALSTFWLSKVSNGHTPPVHEILSDIIYCFPIPVYVQPSDCLGNALCP